jgi:uncharacterized protein (DUF58 family)
VTGLRPTGRGYAVAAAAVALAVIGWLIDSPGLAALAASLAVALAAAPGLACIRRRRARAGLRVHARVRPARVAVGDPAQVEVTVASSSPRPLGRVGIERPEGQWRWNPTDPVGEARWAWRGWRLPGPGALATVEVPDHTRPGPTVAFVVPTARRAVVGLGPRRVLVHDPFGLVGVEVAATGGVTTIVHPRPRPIPAAVLTNSIGPASTTAGPGVSQTGAGDWGGDFAELRPYVVGDRLSLIHWQAQARYGITLVRQFEPEASGLVRVVIDDRAGAHHRQTYEDSLSIALALIEESVAAGLPVELSTFSGRRATVAPTPEGLAGVLELLATMGPRPSSEWSHLDLLVSEFGGFTIVTTATGAPRLPDALARRAQVVTAG